VFERRDRHRLPDDEIGPTSETNLIGWSESEDTYKTEGHALAAYVAEDEMDNADDGFTPLADAQELVLHQLMMKREKRVSDLVMDTNSYGSSNKVTIGTDWDDYANSDPLGDLATGMDALSEANPDDLVLVLGLGAWRALRRHPQILESAGIFSGAGGKGQVSKEALAAALEVRKVIVGRPRYDSANPGQTASYSRIWPTDRALLMVMPENPDRKDGPPPLGRTFRFKPPGKNAINSRAVFDEKRGRTGSWWVQSSFADDEKLIATDNGYLFLSVV
jgi:hypothetical protein